MDGPGVPSNETEVPDHKLISFIQHVNGKHSDLTLWLAGQMYTNTVITKKCQHRVFHDNSHPHIKICVLTTVFCILTPRSVKPTFLFLLTRGPMALLQKTLGKTLPANHTNEISHLLRCQSKNRLQKNVLVKCAINQYCFCRIIRAIFVSCFFFSVKSRKFSAAEPVSEF